MPHSGEGTLGRGNQPYKLDNMTLGKDFHDGVINPASASLSVSRVATIVANFGGGQEERLAAIVSSYANFIAILRWW